MRTKVTKKWLQGQRPCIDGFAYWCDQKKPNLFDFILQCIEDDRFNWANWLMTRCMDRKQYLRYSIYAVKQAAPAYSAKYPEGTFINDSIKAVRACIRDDSVENRDIAGDISDDFCIDDIVIDNAYYAIVAAGTANYAAAYADVHGFGGAPYYAVEATDYTYDFIFTKLLKYGIRIMKEKQE